VAEALQELLDREYEVRLWTHDVFELSQGVLESLLRCADQVDLAVLVLTADDVVASRGDVSCAPRDNVVFELGLFIGALGRERGSSCSTEPLQRGCLLTSLESLPLLTSHHPLEHLFPLLAR
jgi:CAP12/Pycsar effector protein, TIR domain